MKGLLDDVLDSFRNPTAQLGLSLMAHGPYMDTGTAFSNAMADASAYEVSNQAFQKEQTQQAMREALAEEDDEIGRLMLAYPNAAPQLLARHNKLQSFGKSPQYIRDENGQLKPVLFSDQGQMRVIEPPPGAAFQKPVTWQDFGGYQAGFEYGQPYPTVQTPNTLKPGEQPAVRGEQAAASALGKKEGETEGKVIYDLPDRLKSGRDMLSAIDAALSHPGLMRWAGHTTPILGNTDAAGFQTIHDQISGLTFLEAYQKLKGAGQITEIEGTKAAQSMQRLDRKLKGSEYRKELMRLRSLISQDMINARMKAKQARERVGKAPSPTPETEAMDPDAIVDYYINR